MRTLFGVQLSGLSRKLVVLFTGVEVATLTVWVEILRVYWFTGDPVYSVLAAAELFGGLLGEHLLADIAGRV